MKINCLSNAKRAFKNAGFTLVEVVVSTAIIGVMFVSLYGGIASGFSVVSLARENLRANQILIEKMETIRLYTWDQVVSNGFIPSSFNAPFFPSVITNSLATNAPGANQIAAAGGLIYRGSVVITNANVSTLYSNDMRRIVVTLNWTNGGIARVREMQTLVSRYGMQNYVY